MNAPRREQELFEQAIEIASSGDRTAFLDQACGTDQALRQRLERLLGAHATATGFLPDAPASSAFGSPLAALEKPGDQIDRYRLLEPMGEGSFGVVWMAEQVEPVRRRVALKIIKLGMDTRQVVARFDAERQALALMDHPNIARVFDGGATATGRPYFVMELVRGVPITEYCDVHQLSTDDRLELFIQTCHAVQHAHQKGVIHRDLKPSNILVAVQDDRAVPKVIDFGVAKATEARLTQKTLFTRLHQLVGTPAYMSPEQAGLGGLDIDTRSDVYSLGVLLYELLTGQTPFDARRLVAEGHDAILQIIREADPVKPSTRLSTLAEEELRTVATQRRAEPAKLGKLVRGDLDWMVMKALEKDRTRRYTSASAFAEDVRRYQQNLPVEASPPSVRYRLGRWARRNRLLAGSVAAVAATLIFASLVSGYLALVANQARRLARTQQQAAETSAAESRQRLVHNYVANGIRSQDHGQPFHALLWFTEALRQDHPDSHAEEMHRYRIGAALHYAPRLTQLWSHQGGVRHAAFSPDGGRVVTASRDGTARLWEVGTGQAVAVIRADSGAPEIKASPDEEGTRTVESSLEISTQSDTRGTRATRTRSGAALVSRSGTGVLFATFSPDGRRVLTISHGQVLHGRVVRVWDATNGRPISAPMEHRFPVQSALFSPDGKYVYTSTWRESSGEVTSTPDDEDQGELCVWDATSGQPARPPIRSTFGLTMGQLSPDGQWLAVNAGPFVLVWNLRTAQALRFMVKNDQAQATVIPTTAPPGEGDPMSLRRMPDLLPSPRSISGTATSINGLAFCPDSQRLALGFGDGTGRLWTLATGKITPLERPTRSRSARSPSGVQGIAFSPDGRRGLMVLGDDIGRLWDADTAGFVAELPERLNGKGRFSPDGRWLVSRSATNAWLWDTRTGQPTTLPGPFPQQLRNLVFSPDGQRAAVTFGDGESTETRICSWPGGHPVTPALPGLAGDSRLEFSPNGRWLVTLTPTAFATGEDRLNLPNGSAQVWDAGTGQPVSPPTRCPGWSPRCFFTGDSSRLFVLSLTAKSPLVWDLERRQALDPSAFRTLRYAVYSIDPDGNRSASSYGREGLGVYNIATGEALTPLLPHDSEDSLSGASFSPDGSCVVAAGREEARLWPLPSTTLPSDDLVLLAQLLAGAAITPTGETDPLEAPTLQKCWDTLRQRHPDLFITPPNQVRLWREREAEACERKELWFAAAFHLDRLVAETPDDVDLRRRRAYAHEQLAMESLR